MVRKAKFVSYIFMNNGFDKMEISITYLIYVCFKHIVVKLLRRLKGDMIFVCFKTIISKENRGTMYWHPRKV